MPILKRTRQYKRKKQLMTAIYFYEKETGREEKRYLGTGIEIESQLGDLLRQLRECKKFVESLIYNISEIRNTSNYDIEVKICEYNESEVTELNFVSDDDIAARGRMVKNDIKVWIERAINQTTMETPRLNDIIEYFWKIKRAIKNLEDEINE